MVPVRIGKTVIGSALVGAHLLLGDLIGADQITFPLLGMAFLKGFGVFVAGVGAAHKLDKVIGGK